MSLVCAKIIQRRETLHLLQNLKIKNYLLVPMTFAIFEMVASAAYRSSVEITPLGSHDGEFCRFDRALIFEDPNGTRLVYDVVRTVVGSEDERLGDIDVVLLSHVNGDDLGDRRITEVNAVMCSEAEVNKTATPSSKYLVYVPLSG